MKIIEFIAKLPTTNLRILITLLMFIGTGIRYWTHPTWNPDVDWLMFLTLMSGLDVVQFSKKRQTAWRPEGCQEETVVSPDDSEMG